MAKLWFDVGIKRYTTCNNEIADLEALWFDVGIKRYTTIAILFTYFVQLWFDVGIKRYTTHGQAGHRQRSCGLM